MLGVDLLGTIYGIKKFLPLLREHAPDGHIVNTSSIAGLDSYFLTAAPYVAAKHAVVGISEELFHELAAGNERIGVSVPVPRDDRDPDAVVGAQPPRPRPVVAGPPVARAAHRAHDDGREERHAARRRRRARRAGDPRAPLLRTHPSGGGGAGRQGQTALDHREHPAGGPDLHMTATHPEIGVTPQTLIDRAIALRPKLIEEQAATEERTLLLAGDARGVPARGLLPALHPAPLRRLRVRRADVHAPRRSSSRAAARRPRGAWASPPTTRCRSARGRPSRRRTEIFGDGDFRCASVAAPIGVADARPTDGWELNGKVAYCSGIPYSTHYMGQALMPGERRAGRRAAAALRRAAQRVGRCSTTGATLLGLKGSGLAQHRASTAAAIPAHWALEDTFMVDVDVSATARPGYAAARQPACTPGARSARSRCRSRAVIVGAAYNALDEYETMLRAEARRRCRRSCRAGSTPTTSATSARAMAKIATAEAALMNARRPAHGAVPRARPTRACRSRYARRPAASAASRAR